MASIFMRVLDQQKALETLMYVFQNQMKLGKHVLTFTFKHRDGFKEWCRGSIDEVFKGELVKDIEYGDLVLLEHYDSFAHSYIHFNEKIDLEHLANLSKSMHKGAHFIMPRGNEVAYFVIKDYPMASYTVCRNEIISDQVLGNKAYILNNACGKIDHLRGIYKMLTII